MPSRKGKKASEATTDPVSVSPALPALIEAMGRGALTLYLDTVENAEVAGEAGIPFTHANLAEVMQRALEMPEAQREALRQAAMARVKDRYSWDAVTDQYVRLLRGLCGK